MYIYLERQLPKLAEEIGLVYYDTEAVVDTCRRCSVDAHQDGPHALFVNLEN